MQTTNRNRLIRNIVLAAVAGAVAMVAAGVLLGAAGVAVPSGVLGGLTGVVFALVFIYLQGRDARMQR